MLSPRPSRARSLRRLQDAVDLGEQLLELHRVNEDLHLREFREAYGLLGLVGRQDQDGAEQLVLTAGLAQHGLEGVEPVLSGAAGVHDEQVEGILAIALDGALRVARDQDAKALGLELHAKQV